MKPKICASITGRSFREIKELTARAEKNQADLIEIRFDYLTENVGFLKIRKLSRKPLIAVNRPACEGGLSSQPENLRIDTLISAARNGFDYVDIELSTPNLPKIVNEIRKENSKSKVLISFHDYSATPPIQYFHKIMEKEAAFGADVFKIVSTAKTFEDNLIPLNFIVETSKNREIVSFCMGNLGKISRLLSPVVGGAFTYASVKSGLEAAPGQMPIKTMKRIYELMNF